jgi:hypothetical protein
MQNPEMTSFSAADQEVEVEMLLHFSPQKFKSAARIYRGARNARKNTHIPARGYKGVALFFISNAHINAHPQEEPPHREETARPAPVTATTLPPSQRPRAGPRGLEAAQATAGAAARSCRLGRRRARPSSAGHRREKEAGLDGSQTRETRPTAPVRFEFFSSSSISARCFGKLAEVGSRRAATLSQSGLRAPLPLTGLCGASGPRRELVRCPL